MICPHCNKPVPYPYVEARKKARKNGDKVLKEKHGKKQKDMNVIFEI